MHLKLLVLVVAAMSVLGCHDRDPYVGNWKAKYSVTGMQVDLSQSNLADGTDTSHARASKGVAGRVLIADDRGTWKKMSDTNYNEKTTDTTWKPEGWSAAENARITARFNQAKSKLLATANKRTDRAYSFAHSREAVFRASTAIAFSSSAFRALNRSAILIPWG